MAVTLNETPSANRLHIGIFGKTNSGKSSFINAFSGQKVSIVADIAGTTTDPVYKPMEIYPLGPCVLIDTAGFADEGELGALRMEKTRLAAQKTDAGIILFSGRDMKEELDWFRYFKEKNTPVIPVLSKADTYEQEEKSFLISQIKKETGVTPCCISSVTGEGIQEIKENLTRCIPEGYGNRMITGNLVSAGDLVLLVMPQDIQAPKGRLILPQVQTLRELLDKKCRVMSVTTDQFTGALEVLAAPPKLIITDSQVFSYVYERKPSASMLTSFSVLFAAYKGDIHYYVEGAKAIDTLHADSRVLIAECCTHAPLQEDIGRVKIPRMLKKRFGDTLTVDLVSGTDFPEDLTGYDLVIQCGACMFNRKYVMYRIDRAKKQQIPMTNYGVAIAHLSEILPYVKVPE
ncbi:[FeFe] hydrogenase H-cluster maturation GTPase HydF [Ruminococcus sp. AF21-42]|uniref:[FeFe] hydrogenase H-cluster maturation GTPase HydF n=1 Tax=Blautia luti TaxID=89014 RepID=UPI000E4E7B58|nr:[FeFe] hydrogenase H-cluster maturation GTPase HydF [Blautia luti]RHQ89661.1 [FeFe] hydrogenase H-cluster maturation GTPase HydF [Ruminococcus sp. AF21-42]